MCISHIAQVILIQFPVCNILELALQSVNIHFAHYPLQIQLRDAAEVKLRPSLLEVETIRAIFLFLPVLSKVRHSFLESDSNLVWCKQEGWIFVRLRFRSNLFQCRQNSILMQPEVLTIKMFIAKIERQWSVQLVTPKQFYCNYLMVQLLVP